MNTLNKKQYHYTALFCEENIWKLIESSLSSKIIIPVDVLFIINQFNSIALFDQKKSVGENPVIWDYHVVLSAQVCNQFVIFDFDSRCEFPGDIHTYFNKTFVNYNMLDNHYKPFIRSFSAEYFYQHFTSSRQHMKGLIPVSEFPVYDIIKPKNTTESLTLDACRNFKIDIPESSILTPHKYLEHLQLISKSDQ